MANEAAAKKTEKQENPVVAMVHQGKANLIARLPQGIDRNRFFLGIMTAIQKSKANAQPGKSLADCDPNSVLLAAYEAADVGCNLSPSLQLGWLIPYGKEAQFQPSYRFFIQKAYETGEVKTFYAEVVYSGDKFDRQFAPKRNLFHAPGDGERSIKTRVGAYALIEFTDGTIDWEYLTAEQIERHRNHSKQQNSMKWVAFWEEGWRITPIRVIAKRLPLKNRNLEGLIEMINKDAENELAIPVDQIFEPSVPRRTEEKATPAEKTENQEAPKEAATKEAAKDPEKAPAQTEAQAAATAPAPAGNMFADEADPYVTPAQISEFWGKAFDTHGLKKGDVMAHIKKTYNAEALKDLRVSQLNSVLTALAKAE